MNAKEDTIEGRLEELGRMVDVVLSSSTLRLLEVAERAAQVLNRMTAIGHRFGTCYASFRYNLTPCSA
jgi:hypothetical protein